MSRNEPKSAPSETILALVRGELSSARKWFYRGILIASTTMLAVLLSLWTTEPRPLPGRLHIAFVVMTSIALGWTGVLTWILTRRVCPTAIDRIATTWMATVACVAFLVVSVLIGLTRRQPDAAIAMFVTGCVFLSAAIGLLRQAYALRSTLRRQLSELERSSKT